VSWVASVLTGPGLGALLGLATSCAHSTFALGEPTALPSTLQWCSSRGDRPKIDARLGERPLDRKGPCPEADPLCARAFEVSSCTRALAIDLRAVRGKVEGTFALGVTTDQHGRLTDLCLIGSNLGETPLALDCVARLAPTLPVTLDPNLVEAPWLIHWFLD